jgi:hypothetical protein
VTTFTLLVYAGIAMTAALCLLGLIQLCVPQCWVYPKHTFYEVGDDE